MNESEKKIEEIFTILGDNGSIWYGIDKTTAVITPADLDDPKKCIDKMRPIDVKGLKDWMMRKTKALIETARADGRKEVLDELKVIAFNNSNDISKDMTSQYYDLHNYIIEGARKKWGVE